MNKPTHNKHTMEKELLFVGLDVHAKSITRLRRMMALEIEEAPDFLRLYKLAGLNLVTTEAAVPGTSGGR